MKKILTIAMSLLLVAGVLVGCGSKEAPAAEEKGGISGKYSLTSAEAAGVEMDVDMAATTFGEMTFDFKGEGKVEVSIMGQSAEGTYTEEGSAIKVDFGGQGFTFELKDGVLQLDQEGAILKFTK